MLGRYQVSYFKRSKAVKTEVGRERQPHKDKDCLNETAVFPYELRSVLPTTDLRRAETCLFCEREEAARNHLNQRSPFTRNKRQAT